MFETVMAYGQIIIADLILSGDNALIIGMAAAGLSPKLRKRAILYGMVIAAVLRIVFAVIATTLLDIPGILFIGSVLLFWVCWRLFQEIRDSMEREAQEAMLAANDLEQGYTGAPRKTMAGALISITIADVSMSPRQCSRGGRNCRWRQANLDFRSGIGNHTHGVRRHFDHEVTYELSLDILVGAHCTSICRR
jgi:YjbE family integral membrane protein